MLLLSVQRLNIYLFAIHFVLLKGLNFSEQSDGKGDNYDMYICDTFSGVKSNGIYITKE